MGTLLGFFTGSSAGYLTGKIFAGKNTGEIGLFSIIFDLGAWHVHLHHWLISLVLLGFFVFFLRKKLKIQPLFFVFSVGFFCGWTFQGIYCYDDWYQVISRQNIYEKENINHSCRNYSDNFHLPGIFERKKA